MNHVPDIHIHCPPTLPSDLFQAPGIPTAPIFAGNLPISSVPVACYIISETQKRSDLKGVNKGNKGPEQ